MLRFCPFSLFVSKILKIFCNKKVQPFFLKYVSGFKQLMLVMQAVAPVVMKMFSEWSDLVTTLTDIERRIEIIQIHQDLDEQNNPTIPRERPNRHYYKSQASNINSAIQVLTFI